MKKRTKRPLTESEGENKIENNENGQKTAFQTRIEIENNKNGWKRRLQIGKRRKKRENGV